MPIQDIVVKLLIPWEVNPSLLKPAQRQAKVGLDSILALSQASWETMDKFFSPHISGGKCLHTYMLAFLVEKIVCPEYFFCTTLIYPGLH